jgi:hypothetical protein
LWTEISAIGDDFDASVGGTAKGLRVFRIDLLRGSHNFRIVADHTKEENAAKALADGTSTSVRRLESDS